jgi:hypothetical protein
VAPSSAVVIHSSWERVVIFENQEMNEKKTYHGPNDDSVIFGLIAGTREASRDLRLTFEAREGCWMGRVCRYRQKCNLQISIISISTASHDRNPGTSIPVTPWKRVRCCVGMAIWTPYPYPSVPVTGYPWCYPYPCHSLTETPHIPFRWG